MKALVITLMLIMSQFKTQQAVSTKHPNANTMETQSIQVVQEFLTAVQQGNQAKLAAIIHPNIQWNQPGTNRFSGTKKSSAEVFQMVGGMFQATDNSLALTDIKTLTANGNSVACLIHWKAVQPNGGVLDVDNIDVYTVENGKIVQATVYSADIAQEDNFWLK
ncbi:nuclear transport factor 2 family protein [Spirosoma aerolatum]|uniref:nuclear transport factor 2 family protein n=1 Tax=Spirosoma aerolatum TaxID=1211326 RepID=UPI001FEA7E50|nr:nuclear transport factor 2 family protein [Spirosoma aerolatum]